MQLATLSSRFLHSHLVDKRKPAASVFLLAQQEGRTFSELRFNSLISSPLLHPFSHLLPSATSTPVAHSMAPLQTLYTVLLSRSMSLSLLAIGMHNKKGVLFVNVCNVLLQLLDSLVHAAEEVILYSIPP